jgi:hypothetical protein
MLGKRCLAQLSIVIFDRFSKYFQEKNHTQQSVNVQTTLTQMSKYADVSRVVYFLDIVKCFEYLGPNFDPRPKEDFSSLLQIIIELLNFTSQDALFAIVSGLVTQLLDINQFVELVRISEWFKKVFKGIKNYLKII